MNPCRSVPRLMKEAFLVAVVCAMYVIARLTIESYTQTGVAPKGSSTAFQSRTSSATPSEVWIGRRDFLPAIFAKSTAGVGKTGRSFTVDYKHHRLLKDGEPFRIIAGATHYFRVPKDYWKDRLLKMKSAGLNAVYTSVEWSGHEPEKGTFDFEGDYNITAFLATAEQVGLCVVLCLGPYIGSERDNGGLPYWLLKEDSNVKYRSSHSTFTAAVEEWFDTLLPRLSRFLYPNGGPIIGVQVEHKYGNHHACDRNYMELLVRLTRAYLKDQVIIFTTDAWQNVKRGSVEDALATVAIRPRDPIGTAVRELSGPLVVTLDVGVPSHWGSPRPTVNVSHVQSTFERLLELDASVILNVFHGGTNFGFRNGADSTPYTTSHDCRAPLSESGNPTALYYPIRRTIEKFAKLPPLKALDFEPPLQLGKVSLACGVVPKVFMNHFRRRAGLKATSGKRPLTFEQVGQDFGFLVYKTRVTFRAASPSVLRGLQVRDRGYIYTKSSMYIVDSNVSQLPILVGKGDVLVIVVENTGRSSSGDESGARKGLLSQVSLDGVPLTDWTTDAVPLTRKEDIEEITKLLGTTTPDSSCKAPAFFYGHFTLPAGTAARSTYLDLSGWTKGVAYVNGFNLGRYWPAVGPQVTLFVPGPVLLPHPKENLILLFEVEGSDPNATVELVDEPQLDGPTPVTGP